MSLQRVALRHPLLQEFNGNGLFDCPGQYGWTDTAWKQHRKLEALRAILPKEVKDAR